MAGNTEPRIKALLEFEHFELIHNDLINAAFHLLERIRKAVAGGDRTGIGLDLMAAVTMTAFAYEAYLNFIGHTAIKDWNERQSQHTKEAVITNALGIERDVTRRPFATIKRLREARDTMAHGKPTFEKREWEAEGTHSELQETLRAYQAGLEVKIDAEFLEAAYEDVEVVWKLMLKRAEISVWETMDHGASGITFLSYAEQRES